MERGLQETHCSSPFYKHVFLCDGNIFEANGIFNCSTSSCHQCPAILEVSKYVGGNQFFKKIQLMSSALRRRIRTTMASFLQEFATVGYCRLFTISSLKFKSPPMSDLSWTSLDVSTERGKWKQENNGKRVSGIELFLTVLRAFLFV